MPFNLLIFPLAGGYYFFVRFYYFKYLQHRSDSQRLLFNSVIAGIFLLIVTYVIRVLAEVICPSWIEAVYRLLPIRLPYFGTSIVAFLFAIAVTEITNALTKREDAIRKAIGRVGNELEILLMQSFNDAEIMQFTLRNDKFYVGWVTELPLPSKSNYVKIMPAISGYRNERKQLVFTTEYLGVYASYVKEGKIKDISELKTNVILKLDEIVSANLFNIEMYERFNGNFAESQ